MNAAATTIEARALPAELAEQIRARVGDDFQDLAELASRYTTGEVRAAIAHFDRRRRGIRDQERGGWLRRCLVKGWGLSHQAREQDRQQERERVQAQRRRRAEFEQQERLEQQRRVDEIRAEQRAAAAAAAAEQTEAVQREEAEIARLRAISEQLLRELTEEILKAEQPAIRRVMERVREIYGPDWVTNVHWRRKLTAALERRVPIGGAA